MKQGFQWFTKSYVNVLGVFIGVAVVSSILLYSGCGMTSSSPSVPMNPTPTPTPTPTPDTLAPTSTITFPKTGGTISAGVTISVTGTASDAGGGSVALVEVSVDGGATWNPATDTSAWSYTWTPATLGPATIKSRAIDNSRNIQDPPAQVNVTVQDTTPPTSKITSPAAGETVPTGAIFNITGTASDAGGGSVVKVEVSVDGGVNWFLATGTSAWSFPWTPTTSGSVAIKSRAVDNNGNVQDPPAEASVTVRDATRPTSTITAPRGGKILPIGVTVSITGTAGDAGGGRVAKVDVSVDGGSTYSSAMGTTAWSFNWMPNTLGQVTIKSRAVDDSGNQQDPPEEITVTVRLPIRVPSDQPTIQSAIDVANSGDTVLVAPGTYRENINFRGKAITVTSESGPDFTIIDGGAADSVVRFTSGGGRDSALNGFTLQNGRTIDSGGGVTINGASPEITNNVIRNNQACEGGGIGVRFGSPLIQLNTITSNISRCSGGGGVGIHVGGESSLEILDNVISDNVGVFSASGGGIFLYVSGTPIVKRNIIKGNNARWGGGLDITGNSALIVQNIITGNQASEGGGINLSGSGLIIVNNTIADNEAISGSGIFSNGSGAPPAELTNNIIVAKPGQAGLYCSNTYTTQPITRFNNIFSSGGTAYGGRCSDMTGTDGNISADPLFTNPTQGDYHLQQLSPSIDSGDNQAPNLPDKDLYGHPRILDGDGDGTATVDMGVYEFTIPDATWPTSIITSPSTGETILTGTTVNITGIASDADGGSVTRVEVSVNGGDTWNVATGTNAWSYNWSPTLSGQATIKSRSIDDSGNIQEPPAEINITVQDVTPPTSTIMIPTAGATVITGTTFIIAGAASDANGTVARVEVSVDGGSTWNLATGTTAWSYGWRPATPGPATISSRAVDNSGNVQDPPAEINVTVQDTRPTSTITSPTAGATVLTGTAVSINGTASDAGGTVARVEVSVDGGATWNLATGWTAWSYTWTPTTPGPATISSRAVDDSGNQQDPPAEITVTVRTPITIRVPLDQPTIQSAINVADYGDTVLVAPGTYHENIYFGGKAITVTSEGGSDVTIIDGNNANPVVIFNSGSTLNGFTLQNGRAANNQGFGQGGGIRIEGASPRITNNVITNNHACDGGGIFINAGSPLIQMNRITGNINDVCEGGNRGGGIYIYGSGSAEILDNVISDNVGAFGGGINLLSSGTPVIKRNVIKGNNAGLGGGIEILGDSHALIAQNIIIGNQASNGGGIYWIVSASNGLILVNNTIADNNATLNGSGIFADGNDASTELTNNIIVAKPGQFGLYCGDSFGQDRPIIRFNNIFSDGGMAYGGECPDMTGIDGNISADPLFTNPTQGDYHLQHGSPSIDSGDNLTPYLQDTDLDGNPRILDGNGDGTATVDMGVYEFPALSAFNIRLRDKSNSNLTAVFRIRPAAIGSGSIRPESVFRPDPRVLPGIFRLFNH